MFGEVFVGKKPDWEVETLKWISIDEGEEFLSEEFQVEKNLLLVGLILPFRLFHVSDCSRKKLCGPSVSIFFEIKSKKFKIVFSSDYDHFSSFTSLQIIFKPFLSELLCQEYQQIRSMTLAEYSQSKS